jgi:hypothetical protein
MRSTLALPLALAAAGCAPWRVWVGSSTDDPITTSTLEPAALDPQLILPEGDEPWAWRLEISGPGIGAMPVVGRGPDGAPSIAALTLDEPGVLLIVGADSADSAVVMRGGYNGEASPLVADIAGHGAMLVAAQEPPLAPALSALSLSGGAVWRTAGVEGVDPGWCTPSAFSNSGRVEIACDSGIFGGEDGAILRALDDVAGDPSLPLSPPLVADLDLDGSPEIVRGTAIFAASGRLVARAEPPQRDPDVEVHTALLDVDGDDRGDVVGVSARWVSAWDAAGEVWWVDSIDGIGVPCVGDFDGDGEPEIGVPTGADLRMYEADGTLGWAEPYAEGDRPSLPGCVALDADGDGVVDVASASAARVQVRDGGGVELWGAPSDAPDVGPLVAADVDGDGYAELVVPRRGSGPDARDGGLAVYALPWDVPAPASWPGYDHGPANVGPDGEIIADPVPPWRAHGMFRGIHDASEAHRRSQH